MRCRGSDTTKLTTRLYLAIFFITISASDAARRPQRRKEVSRAPDLYEPIPSAESLTAIAQAAGAAEFEHYTEGRPLVKRLIPADSQPDLDVVEHQGVIGRAGVDFPAYPNIPVTGFICKNVPTGYYADLETDCQVFHICDTSRKISFLCPNGTIFSQSHLICDWWFKVDCASAPALYDASAEYYANEQKKSQKLSQTFKNHDLQYIGDSNVRAESRRAPVNIPSTTERLQRHRQRLQTDTPFNIQGTARSYQTFFDYQPTQRSQTTALERRNNLVQLITNTFALPRPTPATVPEAPRREDFNINEMQVAAETASFTNNNNRQFIQDFHSKNYRPYPVYTGNTQKPKVKPNPNLTTLYDIRDKQTVEPSESTLKHASRVAPENVKQLNLAQEKSVRLFSPNTPNTQNYLVHISEENDRRQKQDEESTKRPSLVQYTKSYSTIVINNGDPYTRPGVSALKSYLEREKNKTLVSSTEPISHVTEESVNDKLEKSLDVTEKFESVTKIPDVARGKVYYTETTDSDRVTETTEDPTYKERRERLLKKLSLNNYTPAEETTSSTTGFTEKFYGNQPNRPGLIVPPSLTPKTLHSLAIYYATALDNLSTTPSPEDVETTTIPFDDYEFMEEALPALFSKQTLNKYSSLFGQTTDHDALIEQMKIEANATYNDLSEDLSTQQSQNPLATSPQIRELAQVFTHALSAYLQDPVQFRKVLSDIRPTHPSFGDILSTTEDPYATEPTTTVNEEDDEILGFSDDNKLNNLQNLREAKALSTSTTYPDVQSTYSTERVYPIYSTTPKNPFRCCGRISASYTSPSTPYTTTTTPSSYPISSSSNYYGNSESTTYYSVPKYGGFQNNAINNNDYGSDDRNSEGKPLSEYEEITNLPTAWGVDITRATPTPEFESRKIRTSTYIPTTTPVYFTETDSIELENDEEELQRAHSQSFLPPQSNSLRHGKQLKVEQTSTTVKQPAEDLEVPTLLPDVESSTTQTTTTTQFTTLKIEEPEITTTPAPTSLFTSSDSEKTTNVQWQTPYEDWPSTIIDPITLNDNLNLSEKERIEVEKGANTYEPTSTTEAVSSTEQALSSTTSTPVVTDLNDSNRKGRLLHDFSTEPAQDLSAITDTVVEKAKEIMGGMNSTTTEKLMNVMKKTKSKSVKRLILLLVQTCDDDHNATAEASKRALLDALMAVSQKDMEEIAKETETELPTTAADYDYRTTDSVRRMDSRPRHFDRRGKSIRVEASAVNSLSSVTSTTESTKVTDQASVSSTVAAHTTPRRGIKKYRTTLDDITVTKAPFAFDRPVAEARTASKDDLKTSADTRALELLRSLYSIAARWG